MEIRRLALEGVLEIIPGKFGDARGYFSETYSQKRFAEAGIDIGWVQDNQSFSAERGVLRGLHYQIEHAQGKLQALVDAVGDDNILFETDFPHPTCLYPKPLDTIAEKMSTLTESSRRKILGDNAVKLYRL